MLLFLKVLATEFVAEMGDKTQLMLIALTSKYKMRHIILGTAFAILVLNGLAVLAGGLVSTLIPTWLIRLVAAFAFLFFAITSLKSEEDDEEEEVTEKKKFKAGWVAVFFTFFVAELGDKTQLTAITFGANEGLESGLIVWLGCSLGLFAADIIGMMIGYFLKSKTPAGLLNTIAFFVFSIFGIVTVRQGFLLLLGENSTAVLPVTLVITVVFIVVCIIYFRAQRQKKRRAKGEEHVR